MIDGKEHLRGAETHARARSVRQGMVREEMRKVLLGKLEVTFSEGRYQHTRQDADVEWECHRQGGEPNTEGPVPNITSALKPSSQSPLRIPCFYPDPLEYPLLPSVQHK